MTVLMRKAGCSCWQEGAEGCPALACGSTRPSVGLVLGDGAYSEPSTRKSVFLPLFFLCLLEVGIGPFSLLLCAFPL